MANKQRQRSLFAEFLVVMLGVLAALGLEQWLSEWQERQRVEDTLLAMNEELVDSMSVFRIRDMATPCINAKLDALDAWLADADATGAVVAQIGNPPYFFSSRGGWNSGSAELLARHRSPEIARTYGEVYQGMDEFSHLARREQEFWVQLQPLLGQSGPLDADQRWRVVEAVAGARNSARLLTAISTHTQQQVGRLVPGAEPSMPEFELAQRPLCLPLLQPVAPAAVEAPEA
jgi:hypothetical protein